MLPAMVICHCTGVREGEIRTAIRSGACTLRDVARTCGAGTGCGTCCVAVAEILHQERTAAASSAAPEALSAA